MRGAPASTPSTTASRSATASSRPARSATGVPFALTRHLARLARSAAALGLSMPDDDELRAAVAETLAARERAEGPLAFGRLRITLTGGAGPLGSDRAPGVRTLVVAVAPAKPWPDRIAVATVPWTRNERSAVAGAKTTSYAENVVALDYAHDARRPGGDLREHAGRAVRGHRIEHRRRRGRRARDAAALLRVPGRDHPRAAPGVGREGGPAGRGAGRCRWRFSPAPRTSCS